MEIYTNMRINFNDEDAAKKAEPIIKDYVMKEAKMAYEEWRPEFAEEIKVNGCQVIAEDVMCFIAEDFKEVMEGIANRLWRENLPFTLYTWLESCNCGYEAEVSARLYKNGSFRIAYKVRQ